MNGNHGRGSRDICVMIAGKENKKRNYNQWLIRLLLVNSSNYLDMF